MIGRFLAVHEGRIDNFEQSYQFYKTDARRMPEDLVPIAEDQMGNVICMAFSGPNKESIYLWEQDLQADLSLGESASYDNCYRVANSLELFLGMLHSPPEPPAE